MRPVDFPQANFVLKPPKGLEDEIQELKTHLHATHGPTEFISCWEGEVEIDSVELLKLVQGRSTKIPVKVWLRVQGERHPAVSVTTEDPFVKGSDD